MNVFDPDKQWQGKATALLLQAADTIDDLGRLLENFDPSDEGYLRIDQAFELKERLYAFASGNEKVETAPAGYDLVYDFTLEKRDSRLTMRTLRFRVVSPSLAVRKPDYDPYEGWIVFLDGESLPCSDVKRFRDGGTTRMNTSKGTLIVYAPSKEKEPEWEPR